MSVCRICLSNDPRNELSQLKSANVAQSGEFILLFCLGIQMNQNSDSAQFCSECFTKIIEFHQFKSLALRNEALLSTLGLELYSKVVKPEAESQHGDDEIYDDPLDTDTGCMELHEISLNNHDENLIECINICNETVVRASVIDDCKLEVLSEEVLIQSQPGSIKEKEPGPTVRETPDTEFITSEHSETTTSIESKIHKQTIIAQPWRGGTKKSIVKKLRNSGKQYITSKNRVVLERQLRPPCGRNCRLQCFKNINQDEREQLFRSYWKMASFVRQREFIAKSMAVVQPKYQYKKMDSNRQPNNAFYFKIKGEKTRVCKTFFINTIGVNERSIRTVVKKIRNNENIEDKRGKHGKQRKVTRNK